VGGRTEFSYSSFMPWFVERALHETFQQGELERRAT
jgi:hypothetical protein